MTLVTIARAAVQRAVGTMTLALALAGTTHAQVYDFSQFLSGGGGGQDPQKRKIAQSMGAHICLSITPGVGPNSVRFMIRSLIPQPAARINAVAFDVGRHVGLFRSVAVTMASPGVQGKVVPGHTHAFLPRMTPEYWIDIPQKGNFKPDGLGPGRFIMVSATLGEGKTTIDVINALHEGLNPQTASNGLRIGVLVLYLLGGPPLGTTGTIQDDGGFVTTRPSTTCS